MNVLVIGGGGREHALAWKLNQSLRVQKIFIAPGNAGTSRIGENVAIPASDLDRLMDFALSQAIDLTVVGPDDALAAGVVDRFESAGLRIFGPGKIAAQLESSKSFAKRFMARHGIPTAQFAEFETADEALSALDRFGFPVAVKADGLALGKGVVIAQDRRSAKTAIEEMMIQRRFGEAGRKVVIEEFLSGVECSVHAMVDDTSYLLFPVAQDHKPLYDGNRGPNTGGMGTFCPSNRLNELQLEEIRRTILDPFLKGIQEEKIRYRGLLFPGLMITKEGPRVLEFNCRFGDPETQVLMLRLQSDLVDLLEATIDGTLKNATAQWDTRSAVCVVLASGGYPGSYATGKVISGLDKANELSEVAVFHAGTRIGETGIVTSGGRVLGIAALGETLPEARGRAYDAIAHIEFDGCYFRRDIGSL